MTSQFMIEPCQKENIKTIVEGINAYNLNKVAAMGDTWTPLEYIMKDERN